MQPVRKIARKLAHNDVTELRPGKLRVQVVGSCARRDACVTDRANLGFITAIDLFAMTTKTRVMVRKTRFRFRLGFGTYAIWLGWCRNDMATRTFDFGSRACILSMVRVLEN